MQRLLWGRPAGADVALRGGPGRRPEDAALCPVCGAGPAAGRGGHLQPPALPHRVGGVRRLLVGLWSRPGHTECDVCAGGRWPGGTNDSWALLHRQATCPQALYGDGMSSGLGPSGPPASGRGDCIPIGQCQAGGSSCPHVDPRGRAVLRLLWPRPDGAAFRVRGLWPQDAGPGRAVRRGKQAREPTGGLPGRPVPSLVGDPSLGLVPSDLRRGTGAAGRALREDGPRTHRPPASIQVLAGAPPRPPRGLQPRALPRQVAVQAGGLQRELWGRGRAQDPVLCPGSRGGQGRGGPAGCPVPWAASPEAAGAL